MSKPKVYFTKTITPEKVVEMYKILNYNLEGKVCVKVHSGEKGNPNFIPPEFFKPMVEHVKGTVVECNAAYPGERNTTEKHLKLLELHGWNKYFKTEICDAELPDIELEIPDGIAIKKNYIGMGFKNYDSMLVLSHFKAHGMGGFGGALKQLSIGCGSSAGKCYQHTVGATTEQSKLWGLLPKREESFKEAMADAAASMVRYYKGKIAYVNVLKNIATSCDCDGKAKKAEMSDIGILSSMDPVALDKACLDLIENSNDPKKKEVLDVVDKKIGRHIFGASEKLGVGKTDYELVCVD